MSLDNLPVEWEKVALGNLATTITKGTTPTTMGFPFQSAGINFIKVESLGKNYIDKSLIYNFISEGAHEALKRSQLVSGDLLFSIAGTIGKTALVRDEDLPANTNQALAIIRGVSEFFDVDFLKHQLDFFVNTFKEQARGGAMNNISLQDLKSFNVIFVSQAEQQEIVRQLDVMLAQVEQIKTRLDAIPTILKKFRQSVLADAVSGKLTEEWRGSDNYTIDESGLEIPNGWEFKQIQDIADVKGGKRLPKGEELVSDNTGYPYIRAGQLKNGTIIATEEARSSQMYLRPEVQKLIKNYVIHKYDAYITIVGASIGDAGITPEKYDGANLTENAAKLTNYKKPLLPQFLGFWLRSYYLQQLIKLETKSAAQGKLALTRIKTLPFLYPSIEEQKIIVEKVNDFLSLADGIEQTVQSAQKRVNLLTQSILAKAFSGELTAEWREQHQDLITGVNSAEALLAKIQAEREASKPAKKTRKKKEV